MWNWLTKETFTIKSTTDLKSHTPPMVFQSIVGKSCRNTWIIRWVRSFLMGQQTTFPHIMCNFVSLYVNVRESFSLDCDCDRIYIVMRASNKTCYWEKWRKCVVVRNGILNWWWCSTSWTRSLACMRIRNVMFLFWFGKRTHSQTHWMMPTFSMSRMCSRLCVWLLEERTAVWWNCGWLYCKRIYSESFTE